MQHNKTQDFCSGQCEIFLGPLNAVVEEIEQGHIKHLDPGAMFVTLSLTSDK